jgi:hypothetical protein
MATGYVLPQRVYGNDLPIELTLKGMLYKGELIPYTAIKHIKGSDYELTFSFHEQDGETRPDIVVEVEDQSSHQLFNIPTFISKHLRQTGLAVYDESNPQTRGDVILNAPTYDFSRIRNGDTAFRS